MVSLGSKPDPGYWWVERFSGDHWFKHNLCHTYPEAASLVTEYSELDPTTPYRAWMENN